MLDKPLVKTLVSSLVKDLLGNEFLARYFTELSSTPGQYYTFSSPVVLAGDFEIEIEFLLMEAMS